jgi:hypothetical protein
MIDTRNFVSFPSYGIDEADGTFITKSDFLQRWRQAFYQSSSIITEIKNNLAFFLRFFSSSLRAGFLMLCVGLGSFYGKKKIFIEGIPGSPIQQCPLYFTPPTDS